MTKTKHQRGLCAFHGCQEIGTVGINFTQCFCQRHWDEFQQAEEHHKQVMQEIHERAGRKRAEGKQP